MALDDGSFDNSDDWEGALAISATIRVRRGRGWDVRPEAEPVDGLRHSFTRGWDITEEDSSIYAGEVAWIADRDGWPSGAPTWLASGDLIEIVETR